MDPNLLTAIVMVTLGFACFGEDSLTINGSWTLESSEFNTATDLNAVFDFATLVAVCDKANEYLTAVGKFVPDTGEPAPTLNASPILYLLAVVDAISMLTGFEQPYDGRDLEENSKQFSTLSEQLDSTLPGSAWQGESAQAYAGQVVAIESVLEEFSELDRYCAKLLSISACFVTDIRLALGILKGLLIAAYALEKWSQSVVDPVYKGIVETAMAWLLLTAILAVAALCMLVWFEIPFLQHYFGRLISYYDHFARPPALRGSPLPGKFTQNEQTIAAEIKVAGFDTVPTHTSVLSAPKRKSAIPILITPAPTQQPTMSRKTAKPTPYADMYLISRQATERAPSFAPTAQQSRRTGSFAERAATKAVLPVETAPGTGAVDDAAADGGVRVARRVPVDFGIVDPQQTQESNPWRI